MPRTPHRHLGALERVIMDIIWHAETATGRKVVGELNQTRQIAYTTVMTVMGRLVEKGILARKELKDGSFLYSPKESKEAFYARVSKSFFKEAFKNFGIAAVAQFIDVLEEVDPKQIQLLRRRLDKKD